jgi:KaiC/GvpD/RAD55 family RecA-like ATPase
LVEARIRTHIEGLDEQIEGGIPAGHVVLLSGPPGSMKSSIAYNILYGNAVNEGKKGAIISLEQSKSSLLKQMESLGFSTEKVKEYIKMIDIAYMRKKLAEMGAEGNLLDLFKLYALNMKEREDYDILVVDSLSALVILGKIRDDRDGLFKFFEWLRTLDATILLISESPRDPDTVCDEEFLADGIIHIVKERVGTVDTQLRIVVDKMRATDHHRGYFNLTFKDNCFQISEII